MIVCCRPGYAQAAAQVMGLLFRGGLTSLAIAGAFANDRNALAGTVGRFLFVGGGASYALAQSLLNLLPDALRLGGRRLTPTGVGSLRLAIRSDVRTLSAFGVAVLVANVNLLPPPRQPGQRRRRGLGAAAAGLAAVVAGPLWWLAFRF